jgi:hypothetical protein
VRVNLGRHPRNGEKEKERKFERRGRKRRKEKGKTEIKKGKINAKGEKRKGK